MRWKKWAVWIGVLVAVAALIALAVRPTPIPVEVVEAVRGPLVVTVDEEGRTRVRERYVVAVPVTGQLQRVTLEAGDRVEAGEALFAVLPAPATPLDPRSTAEVRRRLEAAEAGLRSAASQAEFARSELERTEQLIARGALAARDLEAARTRAEAADRSVQEARALAGALRAQLGAAGETGGEPVVQRAPAGGVILRIHQESEAVLGAGTPVLELGDPTDLEVVTDLLSEEAVSIRPGADVRIDRWGGGEALRGRVRRVEPGGYTKISALGVEEQRVDVVIDFVDPPEVRAGLGDGYRVVSRIVTFSADEVITVPVGALFRTGDSWSVFRVEGDRAALQQVRLGRRSTEQAQILEGLAPGDRVVLHPGDRIEPGTLLTDSEGS